MGGEAKGASGWVLAAPLPRTAPRRHTVPGKAAEMDRRAREDTLPPARQS